MAKNIQGSTMKSKIIKNHIELAKFIEGKSVLHLNSFGKDSVVCLEWLNYYAKPSRIVSVNYEFISKHPADDVYLYYLKKRYPKTEFITEPNPHELANMRSGLYQLPLDILYLYNRMEYHSFRMENYSDELVEKFNLDFICVGQSKYESFSRAVNFHKFGLVRGNYISPIGMFKKKEIVELIRARRIKLHPLYKYSSSTFDTPSYYKMRSAMIVDQKYKENVYKAFPLLLVDKYRYEKLLTKKGRQ